MKVHTPATIEDLYAVDGKAELVDGEIILMTPTGDAPSRASLRICMSLGRYEDETRLGRTYPDNVGFVIEKPRKRTFSPDAAFYTGAAKPGVNMRFLEGAPVFAVEVRSENDYGRRAEIEMAAKRADYFAAGTLVVWDVDLLGEEVVKVYRAATPTTPTAYKKGDTAEAEPALPGWTMPVDDLFR